MHKEEQQSGPLEVLKYLFGRLKDARPVTHNVDGQAYRVQSDGTLGTPVLKLAPQWEPPTFNVKTLSALAELHAAGVDNLPAADVAFHIADYLTVDLVALKADEFGRRHVYAKAVHAPDTPFKFNHYYASPEEFLIAFRASFDFNEEAVKVVQLCSTVGAGEAVAVSDDGISQEVVVKTGTVTRTAVTLPQDGIPLIPWRTFREATPVISKFLLRMKGVKDGLPQIALFEIDAKWKTDTQASIAHWLKAHAKEATILA
jgi:hypothetical protein